MREIETVLHPDWVWTEEGPRSGVSVVLTNEIVQLSSAVDHPRAVRLSGKLLLPGFVNAHSHAFQRAIRGHVQWTRDAASDFWTWRDRMYAAANGLSPEGIEAVSRLAFLEMLEAGFTTVGEFHYLHRQADGTPYADPDELARRVIAAALDVGIRIALLRVVYARGGIDVPLGPTQQRFRTDTPDEALAAVARLASHPDPRVTAGLAPHSVRAVPRDWLSELATFAGPVHAHVSEQPAEVRDTLAATGLTPLALLDAHGLVTDRFTAVHLTHPTPDDLARMRRGGARICVCPTTELDLGDGLLPVEAREGIGLCLGTDSHARIDALEEARSLEMHARALAGRRNVMSPPGDRHGLAERLLRALTVEGARALGLPGGAVRVGAPADLVAIDLDRPAAFGVPPLEAAVFAGTPEWVSDVWVGGQHVVVDGRHPARDRVLAAAAPYLRQVAG
ncbi:MAG: formimidoylglutamate deiminase [Alphaproteobacteria bacterium]|nr:formimidoylglutamate deiminase [Alphaproteobacteria bacterium]